MMKFIRLDADNVGDKIEFALLSGRVNDAQQIHNLVQYAMDEIRETVNTFPSWKILMHGCDDILIEIPSEDKFQDEIQSIKSKFQNRTGCSLSIGIGDSLQEALLNLRIAKLKGKDTIVGL